jgi:DNA modification methylase
MSVNLSRELSESVEAEIVSVFENKDDDKLLKILLRQEVFPVKDSYVTYLKRDKLAWDFIDPAYPKYPPEKNYKMLEMIVSQPSNNDSFGLDCFAESGSSLLAASSLGPKCIGIDQSEYSIKTIKERLKSTSFDFLKV